VAGAAQARPVALDVSLSNPYLAAGRGGTVFLRIALTGGAVERADRAANRLDIVERLKRVAEEARADLGDRDRPGPGVRPSLP
jgi:poly-gamma-glutamate capsule biosynthesis protein CapA/YwtB (metallophosphatase superfamily)